MMISGLQTRDKKWYRVKSSLDEEYCKMEDAHQLNVSHVELSEQSSNISQQPINGYGRRLRPK